MWLKFAIGQAPSLNTRTYVLRPPLARPPRPLLLRARSRTRIKKIGVACNGRALVIAIRKKTLIPRDTSVVSILKTILCFIVPSAGILSRQHFDKAFPGHTPFSRTSYRTMNLWTLPLKRIHWFFSHPFPRTASSPNTSAVIRYILTSRSDRPNAFGDRIPDPTALKISFALLWLRSQGWKTLTGHFVHTKPFNTFALFEPGWLLTFVGGFNICPCAERYLSKFQNGV